MPSITVIDLLGSMQRQDAISGLPLMEALRELGAVDAVCGGGTSCGTCAVRIDENWLPLLPPPSEAERVLLEALECEKDGGRLSCQITVSDVLDGMTVRLLPAV